MLPCFHDYHVKCIDRWLKVSHCAPPPHLIFLILLSNVNTFIFLFLRRMLPVLSAEQMCHCSSYYLRTASLPHKTRLQILYYMHAILTYVPLKSFFLKANAMDGPA